MPGSLPISSSGMHTTNSILTIEETAVERLVAHGYDAFVNDHPAKLLSGVSVRIARHDPRFNWSSRSRGAVPIGFMYYEYQDTFVLHIGRPQDASDARQLVAFVDNLVALSAPSEHGQLGGWSLGGGLFASVV